MPDVIVVAAGRRQMGTSFVAAIAALAACRQKLNVLLVDGVPSGCSLHALFGVEPRATLWDLADQRVHPSEVAVSVDPLLTLIPGATPGTALYPIDANMRRAVWQRVAQSYAHVDLIIIDAGSTLDAVRTATEALDAELLLVTSADRVTMAATHALAKASRATHPQRRIALAANRDVRGLESCEQLNAAAARFLGRPLLVAGSVPDDRSVQTALHAGFNLIDAAEDSIATIAVTGILAARANRRETATVIPNTTAPLLALSRSRS